MKEELVSFKAKDNIILNGILYKTESKTDKILIQIHGMTSNCFKARNRIIANEIKNIGIDTLDFNNRGSEVVRYISDGRMKKIAGTAYENFEECYYDIVGVIEFVLSIGYKNIYLQGHSLGCTKIVYTYQKLLEESNPIIDKIKGIILLSLIDIPGVVPVGINEKYIEYAVQKEKNGEIMEMMPLKSFIHPVSVKNFLKYTKYNQNIDFAKYDDNTNEYTELNNIKCPLFMRWGNNNEMIKQDAKELSDMLNDKVNNKYKDIGYIDGADHSYHGKEELLASQIKNFLK